MSDPLAPLRPYRDEAQTRRATMPAPGPRPDETIAGYMQPQGFAFVATRDLDGQIEASISVPHGRPQKFQIRHFFAVLGIEPDFKPLIIAEGRGLHWVVVKGKANA